MTTLTNRTAARRARHAIDREAATTKLRARVNSLLDDSSASSLSYQLAELIAELDTMGERPRYSSLRYHLDAALSALDDAWETLQPLPAEEPTEEPTEEPAKLSAFERARLEINASPEAAQAAGLSA